METKKNIGEAKIVGQPKAPFRFKLKDGCVKSNHLAEESVATDNIQNAAVSTEKIMDEAVTNAKIMNGAITNSKISNGTITNEKIANNSIDNSKIQNLTLTGDKFTDNSIDGSKIKDNSVPGSKLADGAIESIDLQDNTLSGSKLADNSVDGDKLVDGAVTSEKLKDNSIDGSKIADGTIQSLDIKDGTISGAKLANNTITGDKLANGIIDNNKIANNSITGDKFLDESISGEKIQANTIHGSKLEDNTVDGADIIEGTLNGSKIADMSIDGNKLADDSIETRHIKSNTISGSKIVTNSIDSTKIRNNSLIGENIATGTLTGDKFVDNTITGDKIIDNTLPGSKIKDGTIESVDIKDNTLSGAKLIDNSISGSKIADNAITSAHLLDNSIPASKILDGTIESIDIKDGTLEGSKVKDNTITGAKLADNVITSAKLSDNSVTTDKIVNLAVTEGKIATDAVTSEKISNGSVTETKLGTGAVTTNKIVDNSVTTAKIADSAVTEDKLADGAITSDKIADDVITELQTIMDEVPTKDSVKPVQSGGVQNELALGAVYDVSAKNPAAGPNSDGKFESLSALLSDASLNTLIPTTVRKGGMSIKFVLSSDNKYIQARCMAQNFTTDVTQWQGVDDEPAAGSQNLVKSGGVADYQNMVQSVLDITNIEAEKNLKVGSISAGQLDVNAKDCLCSDLYVSVYPSSKLLLFHANDISIRINEYTENKTYIKHTPYSKIDYIILSNNTRYVRISAFYGERGFSNSNPVTIDDYQEGDFGLYISKVGNIIDTPTTDTSKVISAKGTVENSVLYSTLSSNFKNKDYKSFIKVGTLNSKGVPTQANTCLYINNFFRCDSVSYILCGSKKPIRLVFYDIDKTFITWTGTYRYLPVVEVPSNAYWFRVSIEYVDDGYSDTNKITPAAYSVGDFYVKNFIINIDDKPLADSDSFLTSGAIEKVTGSEIDVSKLYNSGYDDTSQWFTDFESYKGVCIKCSKGSQFIVTAGENPPFYSFLTDIPIVHKTTPVPRVPGTTRQRMAAGETKIISVPDGTNYFYLSTVYNNVSTMPSKVVRCTNYYGVIDDLLTDNSSLPLSAKQGKLLKEGLTSLNNTVEGFISKEYYLSRTYFRSGGNYRGDNDSQDKSAIMTPVWSKYFSVSDLKEIKVLNKGRQDGCYWKTRVVFFNEKREYITQTNYIKDVVATVPANAKYFSLGLALFTENDEEYYTANNIVVTPYMLGIHDLTMNSNEMDDENKVIERNLDVQTACQIAIIGSALSIGHISDIHGDMGDKQFANFVKICNEYCDVGIITGDIVYQDFTDTYNFYDNYIGDSKNPILLALGNHDVGSSKIIAECGTHVEAYNKFFADNISNWDVIQPENAAENGCCYYYKDYSSKKIRMIVMYDFESPLTHSSDTEYAYFRGALSYSTEQLSWLIGVLQDAATKDYSVIIAKHMMEGTLVGESSFMSVDNPKNISMTHLQGNTPVADIINAFQTSASINETYNTNYGTIQAVGDFTSYPNGKFACYICGHYHKDLVGTLSKYQNQNVIAIDCDNTHNTAYDIAKHNGTRSMDTINVIKVDNTNRRITIARVGGNYSKTAQHRDMIMLTY